MKTQLPEESELSTSLALSSILNPLLGVARANLVVHGISLSPEAIRQISALQEEYTSRLRGILTPQSEASWQVSLEVTQTSTYDLSSPKTTG